MDTALILSLLGALSLVGYLALRVFYLPKIKFRIAGEHLGEPIPVPQAGSRGFAVTTRSRHRVELSEVAVAYELNYVDLSGTQGAEADSTLNAQFPFALFFRTRREIVRGVLQGNFFNYKAQAKEFSLRFSAVGKVDETELPFLVDMFSPKKFRAERIVRYRVVDNHPDDFRNSALLVKPGEIMASEGPQAQNAVWAQADGRGAEIRMIETLEGEPPQHSRRKL